MDLCAKFRIGIWFFVFAGASVGGWAQTTDFWNANRAVPAGGTANVYSLNPEDWQSAIARGQLHAQVYPVAVTGILLPAAPLKKLVDVGSDDPIRKTVEEAFQWVSGIHSWTDFLSLVGLVPYPEAGDQGIYSVSLPDGQRPDTPMGYGERQRNGATGFTFSCATCHAGRLFGKTILGLTNRFPRANDFFAAAKLVAPFYSSAVFENFTQSTPTEAQMMQEAMSHLDRVEVKRPLRVGLDTALAQVALSLNRREDDPQATPSDWYQLHPRADSILDHIPADSKPAVWWNLKYKNRWLSDGSIVAGDPVYTNLLWNEIGRGGDLVELESWLKDNSQVVQDLTTMVYATEAPRFTDFFSADLLQPERVRAGQTIFKDRCVRCHGSYVKAWDDPAYQGRPWRDQLQTLQVIPKILTPIRDVGTDSNRWQAMKSLEKLNRLALSQANGIVVQAQNGYVPPPLVGIWARWPYFHNNSIPSLCALLTPSAQRPSQYYAGAANDPATDFDIQCNGYPLGDKIPAAWKKPDFLYQTNVAGLGNQGHDEDIFVTNGVSELSDEDRLNLIQFLQTL